MTRATAALLALTGLLAGAPASAQTSSHPGQSDPASAGGELVIHVPIPDVPRPDGDVADLDVILPVDPKPWPTILFVHGWSAEPHYYTGLAEQLASRGFAVAMFDQVDRFELDLDQWRTGGQSALDALERATSDPASPLYGQLDLSQLGVLGHSYGGATTIALAATDPRVKVAVALTPGVDRRETAKLMAYAEQVTLPLLVLGAEFDPIVPVWRFPRPAFQRVPSQRRLYVEIARGEHNNFTDLDFGFYAPTLIGWRRTISPEEQRRISRGWSTSWLEHHTGQRAWPEWVDGRRAQARWVDGELSRWQR